MSTAVRVRSPSEAALALVQQEFPEYHPLIALARLAHRKEVTDDPKLELEVHKTILPYVAPKLANVEVKADIREERRVIVSLFEDHRLPDGRTVDVEIPYVIEDATEVVPLD